MFRDYMNKITYIANRKFVKSTKKSLLSWILQRFDVEIQN